MSLLKVFTRRLSKKNIQKAELNEIWRYGLSKENAIIAADRSQNLLAIGTNKVNISYYFTLIIIIINIIIVIIIVVNNDNLYSNNKKLS